MSAQQQSSGSGLQWFYDPVNHTCLYYDYLQDVWVHQDGTVSAPAEASESQDHNAPTSPQVTQSSEQCRGQPSSPPSETRSAYPRISLEYMLSDSALTSTSRGSSPERSVTPSVALVKLPNGNLGYPMTRPSVVLSKSHPEGSHALSSCPTAVSRGISERRRVSSSQVALPCHISMSAGLQIPLGAFPLERTETISGTPRAAKSGLDDYRASSLDASYRVRSDPRNFFCMGTVLQILWSEPADSDTASASLCSMNYMGERVLSKVRWFVVIRQGHQSCTAIQISTYGSRGVNRRGVKKSDHGIIYTGTVAPQPLAGEATTEKGEMPMQPIPIRVIPFSMAEQLSPASRLNYGKVYTIEFNVKAKGFGYVHDPDLEVLRRQFQAVFFGR